MLKIVAVFTILAGLSSGQITNCKPGFLGGGSTAGVCPCGYVAITNGMCCQEAEIITYPCRDAFDANGETMCPLTKIGCGRNLLKYPEEENLCTATCGFCRQPGTCVDLRLIQPFGGAGLSWCNDVHKPKCNSTDILTRNRWKSLCPKLCGMCK